MINTFLLVHMNDEKMHVCMFNYGTKSLSAIQYALDTPSSYLFPVFKENPHWTKPIGCLVRSQEDLPQYTHPVTTRAVMELNTQPMWTGYILLWNFIWI